MRHGLKAETGTTQGDWGRQLFGRTMHTSVRTPLLRPKLQRACPGEDDTRFVATEGDRHWPPSARDKSAVYSAASIATSPLAAVSPSMTSLPSAAETITTSPSLIRPSNMRLANGFCSERWITRFSGLAP